MLMFGHFGGRRVEIGVGNGKEVRDHVGVSHVSEYMELELEVTETSFS
jgi:hypothetical protein